MQPSGMMFASYRWRERCTMFRSFGLPELAIILVIVMVLFGTTRLPGIGKSLGASMRAFKQAITGEDKGIMGADLSTDEASQDLEGKT